MIAGESVLTPPSGANASEGARAPRSSRRASRKVRRRRGWALLVVAVAIVAAIAGVVATGGTNKVPPHKAIRPPQAAGMSLAFDPMFSGKFLDTKSWQTCYAWFDASKGCTNFGNAVRDAWYLPSGVRVSKGTLRLTATKKATAGFTESGAPLTYPYTSGMVTTRKSFDFTYGYVQIEAKTPGGGGTWPALWLLAKSETWPPEIDIMESWGTTRSIRTTVFWSAAGTVGFAHKTATAKAELASGYHTYGLLWKPDSLTWYLDGKVVDRYTGANVPDQPMYLLANLAIDGRAKSGSTLSIRSIQIYRYDSSK
jgi:beta-glucanase (GH16 family)